MCEHLRRLEIDPTLVVEPTCGAGSFLLAAADAFPTAKLIGVEIDADHVAEARRAADAAGVSSNRLEVFEADVFDLDWDRVIPKATGHVLALGNPPWVTTDAVSRGGGRNQPKRRNVGRRSGLDAMTGAGTFDLSEAVLLALIEFLGGRDATVAMLCKVAVARRLVRLAARRGLPLDPVGLWTIDARKHFGAAVAAGLFVFRTLETPPEWRCPVAPLEGAADDNATSAVAFGVVDGVLVANVDALRHWRDLVGVDALSWRSGIKHDCAAVMELRRASAISDGAWTNGEGEVLDVEDTLLFPLLRGTDLRHGRTEVAQDRRVIVTQRRVGEPTEGIARLLPKTWDYLSRHRERFERRASRIWRRGPDYSIFGIGPYSFAPHKVAICGFSRELRFEWVGPIAGRPVMVDDTCYFLSFEDEDLARATVALLESTPAREILAASLFPDAKRPITKALLERLHLGRLASRALTCGGIDGVHDDALAALIRLADGEDNRRQIDPPM